MKVLDLNILLYAVNSAAAHHPRIRNWLESVINEQEAVGLPWSVILGFLRISTRHGIFPRPLEVSQALACIEGWLTLPIVVPLDAGDQHWKFLRQAIESAGTAGNLTTDAHLAAIALERDATLCSTDNDFRRFGPRLRFLNPLL